MSSQKIGVVEIKQFYKSYLNFLVHFGTEIDLTLLPVIDETFFYIQYLESSNF